MFEVHNTILLFTKCLCLGECDFAWLFHLFTDLNETICLLLFIFIEKIFSIFIIMVVVRYLLFIYLDEKICISLLSSRKLKRFRFTWTLCEKR